jgi:hypothetical protein
LEGLVKLARRKKDVKGQKDHIVTIHATPIIIRVSVNKAHHN